MVKLQYFAEKSTSEYNFCNFYHIKVNNFTDQLFDIFVSLQAKVDNAHSVAHVNQLHFPSFWLHLYGPHSMQHTAWF